MSTLIVTSVVLVYAIASMAYVASSEQRATRHRHPDRGTRRPAVAAGTPSTTADVELSLPPTQPVLTIPAPRGMPAWLDTEADAGVPEFIRGGPVEYEPTGPWRRIRSSAALLVLLTIVGAVFAAVVGAAAVVTILALKNAAG